MIKAIEKNFEKGIYLLSIISDAQYSNQSVPPYFSSIGSHFRHTLDMFSCVINGFNIGNIDFTIRERNKLTEQKCEVGILYSNTLLKKIKLFTEQDLKSVILITDDFGFGKHTAKTTLRAALMQAQSHAIHHYATIGFIIYQLGIDLPENDFGYNPTTTNKKSIAS